MRGVARREGAWPGFRQTGPIARAGPERRDPDAHDACVRVLPARHAASFRFRVFGGRTEPAVRSAAGRLPECRPGTWLTFATLAGAASRPTSRRLMRAPLDGRDALNLG